MRKRLGAGILLSALLALPVAAQTKILALGDSLTQGYGLDTPADGLVPQLQDWLHAHGADVTVVNGGVSGDTTAGGRARLDWLLTPDTKAVIVALGGNDLLRGLPPSEARANLDAILADLQGKGIPRCLQVCRRRAITAPITSAHSMRSIRSRAEIRRGSGAQSPGPDHGDPAGGAREGRPDAARQYPPLARGVKKVVAALGPKVLELLAKVKPDS